jgi:hypothetical protein
LKIENMIVKVFKHQLRWREHVYISSKCRRDTGKPRNRKRNRFKTSEDLNVLETSNRLVQWILCIYVLWCIDLLLGKNLKINNQKKVVAMQRRGKHASTIIELLLEMVLSTRSVQRGYKEENWGDPLS